MTELDPNTLPLAIAGKALNRVIGTQVDDQGVSSLALFPLKVLAATGGRIVKVSIATTPATSGEEQPATLTVITDDGGSYPVKFTIPPGARGYYITDVECEQENVTPGEASLIKLTFSLDDGSKLSPIEVKLPPGKDSLTITDTSVTQEPVEPGKPSKVTVTVTHSDGSKAVYSYDAPPGAEGYVDPEYFVTRKNGLLNSPTIYFGPDESYTLIPQSDGNLVAYDDKKNVLFSLNNKEGHIGAEKIATISDVQAETTRAQNVEASLLPSKPASVSDAKLGNIVWNTDGGLLATQAEGQDQWETYYPTGKSAEALTYSVQDARPKTIRTLKSGWQDKPQLIVENDGFADFNGASVEAVTKVVDAETSRAEAAEAKLLPLTGGQLSGALTVNGQFAQDGETLSERLGAQVDNGQFYMQAIHPDNSDHMLGRLFIKDLNGSFNRVLEADTQGNLKNLNGKLLATTDDIQAEKNRALASENSKLPLVGGTLSGDITLQGNIYNNNLYSKTIHLTAEGDKTESQIQLLGTTSNPSTCITTVDASGKRASLFLNIDNSVTTARGTSLPEIMMSPAQPGRVVIQAFQYVAANGAEGEYKIIFPQSFSSPPTGLFFSTNREATSDGAKYAYIRTIAVNNKNVSSKEPDVTKDYVSVYSETVGCGRTIRSSVVWVTAIGIM